MLAIIAFASIVAAFFASSLLVMGISYLINKSKEGKEENASENTDVFRVEGIKYLLITLIPYVIIFNILFILQEAFLGDKTAIKAIIIISIFIIGWIVSWSLGKRYSMEMMVNSG